MTPTQQARSCGKVLVLGAGFLALAASNGEASREIERNRLAVVDLGVLEKERAGLVARWGFGPPILDEDQQSWVGWRRVLEDRVDEALEISSRLANVSEQIRLQTYESFSASVGVRIGGEIEKIPENLRASVDRDLLDLDQQQEILELVAAGDLDGANEAAVRSQQTAFLEDFLAMKPDGSTPLEHAQRLLPTFREDTNALRRDRMERSQIRQKDVTRLGKALKQDLKSFPSAHPGPDADASHWRDQSSMMRLFHRYVRHPAFIPPAPAERMSWEEYLKFLSATLLESFKVPVPSPAHSDPLLPETWTATTTDLIVGTLRRKVDLEGSKGLVVLDPILLRRTLYCETDLCFVKVSGGGRGRLVSIAEAGAEISLRSGPLSSPAPASAPTPNYSYHRAMTTVKALMTESPGILVGFPSASASASMMKSLEKRLRGGFGRSGSWANLESGSLRDFYLGYSDPETGLYDQVGNLGEWSVSTKDRRVKKNKRTLIQSLGTLGGDFSGQNTPYQLLHARPRAPGPRTGFRPIVVVFSGPERVNLFDASSSRSAVSAVLEQVERLYARPEDKLWVLDHFERHAPNAWKAAFESGFEGFRSELLIRQGLNSTARGYLAKEGFETVEVFTTSYELSFYKRRRSSLKKAIIETTSTGSSMTRHRLELLPSERGSYRVKKHQVR